MCRVARNYYYVSVRRVGRLVLFVLLFILLSCGFVLYNPLRPEWR